MVATKSRKDQKTAESGGAGFGSKTILFNDDFHTFEEVSIQLMKATRCSFNRGMELALEVHRKGRAIVFSGHLERCEAVAMVLGQIALQTAVER